VTVCRVEILKMKIYRIVGMTVLASVLAGNTISLRAQETNEVEQLKRQLLQMQADFARQQAEQQKQIAELTRKLDALTQQTARVTTAIAPETNATAGAEAVTSERFRELDEKVNEVVAAQKKSLVSEFNPAIGVVGETIFSQQSKGSPQNGTGYPGGFDVYQRSVELNAAASVDPFAKGWVVINGSADSATGNTSLDVEEAALQTTSLPGNLTVTAGQFFGEFGRLAYIHDHELPFVNRPLVLDQYIGGESKTYGAQANWLVPTEHYLNLTTGLGTQFGNSPDVVGDYRSFGAMDYWSRLSTYFDLSDNWQLEGGVSGLINPDAGNVDSQLQPDGVTTLTETKRRLLGADLKLSYVPLRDNQFNSLTWGNEVLYSDNEYRANAPSGNYTETVGAWGMYSYLTYKWSRTWSGGFLFEFLQNDQNNAGETYAYSPYLTWAVSHWNQLRLQYTHTQPNAATGNQPNDAVYLQWTWIIGAHSHGWTQR
jgi:hypothetical protein